MLEDHIQIHRHGVLGQEPAGVQVRSLSVVSAATVMWSMLDPAEIVPEIHGPDSAFLDLIDRVRVVVECSVVLDKSEN